MSEGAGGRALVVGLGNPLMGDDGLGLAALSRLDEDWDVPPTVELVDGGTWGLELLHRFEGATQVLLLDAVDAGREPGAPVELEREDLPRLLGHKLSPHQIELREVLALAELRGTLPASLACLGLQPASVELRAGLSPPLAARLGPLAAAAAARLRAWGHPVRARPARAHA
jgi:hydrogenase maturation protease